MVHKAQWDYVPKLIETADRSLVIVGSSYNTPYTLVLNSDLQQEEYFEYPQYNSGSFHDVFEGKDGSLLLTGHTRAADLGGGVNKVFGLNLRIDRSGKILNSGFTNPDPQNKIQFFSVIEDALGRIISVGEVEGESPNGKYLNSGVFQRLSSDFRISEAWSTGKIPGSGYFGDLIELKDGSYLALSIEGSSQGDYCDRVDIIDPDSLRYLNTWLFKDFIRAGGQGYESTRRENIWLKVLELDDGFVAGTQHFDITSGLPVVHMYKFDLNGNVHWSKFMNQFTFSYMDNIQLHGDQILLSASALEKDGDTWTSVVLSIDMTSGETNWESEVKSEGAHLGALYVRPSDGSYAVLGFSINSFTHRLHLMEYKLDATGKLKNILN
ncbi:MAG: hypothetical protein H6606_06200 [Flavobacteriales bacterium]|nr:hypothetical protein [Flavobacteriales bacterium]